LHGTVIEGKAGATDPIPTANVQSSDPYKIIPGHGVYTVLVRVNGQTYKGMLNMGRARQ
jgi:FAD synthase